MTIEVRQPRTQEELDLYYDLRWRVLREQWTRSRESGRDEHEENAFHLTAWDGPKLVGTGRLHFNSPDEAQIRCMAVEEAYRSTGVGGLIIQALEQRAREQGAKFVMLNAREGAVSFYRKHGYQLIDQSNTLFNQISHWRMHKNL
jgi:N-acetylglutamate synthase-like GNAT family acetyltransferase